LQLIRPAPRALRAARRWPRLALEGCVHSTEGHSRTGHRPRRGPRPISTRRPQTLLTLPGFPPGLPRAGGVDGPRLAPLAASLEFCCRKGHAWCAPGPPTPARSRSRAHARARPAVQAASNARREDERQRVQPSLCHRLEAKAGYPPPPPRRPHKAACLRPSGGRPLRSRHGQARPRPSRQASRPRLVTLRRPRAGRTRQRALGRPGAGRCGRTTGKRARDPVGRRRGQGRLPSAAPAPAAQGSVP
jgi:hypothetical protein